MSKLYKVADLEWHKSEVEGVFEACQSLYASPHGTRVYLLFKVEPISKGSEKHLLTVHEELQISVNSSDGMADAGFTACMQITGIVEKDLNFLFSKAQQKLEEYSVSAFEEVE